MGRIRALAFDVGGSVFDWRTAICDAVADIAEARKVTVDADAFATDWRAGMFQRLAAARSERAAPPNADQLHRQALDELARKYAELDLGDTDRDELNRVWHRMPVWPEFPAALTRLREQYPCFVLTVLSFSIVVDSSRLNGFSWDGVLSCEFLGHYKPDTKAFTRACELMGLAPRDVTMVAAHPSDLRAARAAGLSTAFVAPRLAEPDDAGDERAPAPNEFAWSAENFEDLATQLCDAPRA